jgi:hypothetical protein
VIGTDCTGNCKSNYHTITTAPHDWTVKEEWKVTWHDPKQDVEWMNSLFAKSIYML